MTWPAVLGTNRLERAVRGALLLILFAIPFSVVLILDQSNADIAGRYNQFAVPVLYPLEALIGLTGLGWLWLRRNGLDLWPYRWLAPAILVAVASVWWAPDPLLALSSAIHLGVAFTLLVMLARELRDELFLMISAWTVTASAGVQVLIGTGQFLMGHDLGLRALGESALSTAQTNVAKVGDPSRLRAYGTFSHPNVLAAFLAAAIFWVGIIVFWPYRRRVRLKQALLAAGLILLGAGLLLTFSRAALVMVAVNGALVVLFATRRWKRLPLAAGAAAIGVALVALLLLPTLMSRTNLESSRETGISNRTAGYELALQMISDRPLGVGAGNFVVAAPELRDLPDYQYQPAHNAALLAAAELGAIPALLVLMFVARVGWRFHRLRPRAAKQNTLNFSLFALAGTCIALGMVDHFFWSLPQGLWIICVVLAAVIARIPAKRFATV